MYIPICEKCNLCVPSRINLNKFKISKSNKRNLKINEDLKLIKASKNLKKSKDTIFLNNTVKKDMQRAKWET